VTYDIIMFVEYFLVLGCLIIYERFFSSKEGLGARIIWSVINHHTHSLRRENGNDLGSGANLKLTPLFKCFQCV
jgi:hypothetical protein